MIKRSNFFDGYRNKFGKLNDNQVRGLEFLLEKLDDSHLFNLSTEYAYILATVKHETADTFQPVIEAYHIKNNRKGVLYRYYQRFNPRALKTIFPFGLDGRSFEGRGYVQLTHDYNYKTLTPYCDVDLYKYPDEAMKPEIAWKILQYGMYKGLFTGKRMSQYIREGSYDFYHARKIINGLDKADRIRDYANRFNQIIEYE